MDSLSPSFHSASTRLSRHSKPSKMPTHKKTILPLNVFQEPITKTAQRIKLIINTNQTNKKMKMKGSSLLASTFKSIDDLICAAMDLPLRPSIDPKHVLSGNFAPVDELPPTPCEVAEGSIIPSCLDGVYLLNGPNPQHEPRGPYHLLDGDGMLHAIRISGGEATFCSRYVETYKYGLERGMGYPVVPSLFSSFNGVLASIARVGLGVARFVAGQFDPLTNGYGTANTSIACIGGKLYALGEGDLPYEIKVSSDGDITTIGRENFHCSHDEEFMSMTAHPKIDPETGEAFAFRYQVPAPYLTYFRIDAHGRKQPDVPIFTMENAAIMHDFAVTKNYAIFNDVQMVVSPVEILKGKVPMRVDLEKTPRLGVIEKYAKGASEMWWVDAPGLNISHAVNAWEEDDGDTLVLVATNISSVEHMPERLDLAETKMEEIRISVKRKEIIMRRRLSNTILDMPVINPAYAGKKTRYTYAARVIPPTMNAGVAKVDLSLSSEDGNDCIVGSRLFGSSCVGNEPFFVPRDPNDPGADEDDGFLVAYVHDMNTQESKFLVMDAKSPTLDIVGVVKLPGRVPCCFHGLFVSENQLNKL